MKNRNVLSLSGWGQIHDSLKNITDSLSPEYQTTHLSYNKFAGNVDSLFKYVGSKKYNPEIVIGWSLGGQLSTRLVAKNILKPKLLILIAPPFQFVKTIGIKAAMGKVAFKSFQASFRKMPNKTLKTFGMLSSIVDVNAGQIYETLDFAEENHHNWDLWLDELGRFSCEEIDFSNFPKTILFHGRADKIVHASQAELFAEKIPDIKLEMIKGCGHAPHLKNPELIKSFLVL